jgi:hypothetical protein
MEKKISYLARDFQSIKGELIKFSKKYYPELSDNFNDASVGAWFIDLMSAVGDDLSYHTDRMYQETNLDSAKLRSSVLNAARLNGVKIPGPKCSLCEVEISVLIPVNGEGSSSTPNWTYAPLIKRGSTVGNTTYLFELSEDVDFGSQFNSNGVSNRTFIPMKNANGQIINYKITKTVIAYGGTTKIYKKVLTESEVMPFMEIILPEQNICNVESIIFKETSTLNSTPQMFEFFIEEEEYKILNQDISTYRYFEVNSLSDQYRFASQTSFVERDGEGASFVVDLFKPQVYEDYADYDETSEVGNARRMRFFQGKWKGIRHKFITEYTDNNFLKIIFGCGTDINEDALRCTPYGNYITSKIINNDMLGLMPKAGWVMYVLYRVGGGIETNLGIGSINKFITSNVIFPKDNGSNIPATAKSEIINSLKVINKVNSIGGKDAPSTEEIKFMTKYFVNNQNRCITLKDYKSKVMQIPPKFGCPFRCNAMEDNNKIIISLLNVKNDGKLTTVLPKMMIDNIVEYLSHYKSLNDYVEIHSGKIFNIGFEVDVFVDKNYTTTDVINKIIDTITNYFDINKHDMGEDIFIGDLEKEINVVDGVISLIDLRAYSLYDGNYSFSPSPLPEKSTITQSTCDPSISSQSFRIENGTAFEIDLNAIDHVLYNDIDSMFEIKFPNRDIQVRVKLR